ncbi:hypothetical protein ABEF91_000195 [Exophiala dermatitidis]
MDDPAEDETRRGPFSCHLCLKTFTRQENLNRHVGTIHSKNYTKSYQCETCFLFFSRDDLRKRHIKRCHTVEDEPSKASNPETLLALPAGESLVDPSLAHESSPPLTKSSKRLLTPQHIESFFEKFHPIIPMLHQPTFDITTTPEPLLAAMACLGAMCESTEADHPTSRVLFEVAYEALYSYIGENQSRLRETWVLQAFILLEIFGIYSCNDKLFFLAQKIHRDLVDGARELRLLEYSHSAKDTMAVEVAHALSEIGYIDYPSEPAETRWHSFIEYEARKRSAYALFYVDAQFATCCNYRPLLSAMELKYELPCRDDLWSAPDAETWSLIRQDELCSFNDEDDFKGNPEPLVPQGFLYESMTHLVHPTGEGKSLKMLWFSPFAALMLVVQILMTARELTLASVFLCSNLRPKEERHNLSIIDEESRGPIMHALNNLVDLIPRGNATATDLPAALSNGIYEFPTNKTLWHSVWTTWYYTAMTLSHQEALLCTGIVECNLPAAISTAWELGKPRAKTHRDVYDDRDVFRLASNLEKIIELINNPPLTTWQGTGGRSFEDPFISILSYKACMVGWRLVRLMSLSERREQETGRQTFYAAPIKSVMGRITKAAGLQQSQPSDRMSKQNTAEPNYEFMYLEWAERSFSSRNVWPIGSWMSAVLKESMEDASISESEA